MMYPSFISKKSQPFVTTIYCKTILSWLLVLILSPFGLIAQSSNCPPSVIVGTSSGSSSADDLCDGIFSWTHPAGDDTNPIVNLTMTILDVDNVVTEVTNVNPGDTYERIFELGTSTIRYSFVFNQGFAECTFTVTVQDDENPVFSNFPNSMLFNNISGTCTAPVTWIRPLVDDCSILLVEEQISNAEVANEVITNFGFYNLGNMGSVVSANFPVGMTTIEYRALDSEGNPTAQSFVITVNDTETPEINCPPAQNLGGTCVTGIVPDYTTLAVISDNCPDGMMITQNPTPGTALESIPGLTITDGATFDVTLTVTDENSTLSNMCTFVVTLDDDEAPIPTIAGSSLPTLNATCGSVSVLAPTASDCGETIIGIPSFGQNIGNNIYLFEEGSFNVVWSYIDIDNNISAQSQQIVVSGDNDMPTVFCQSIVVDLPESGTITIDPAQIDNGSSDNCGISNMNISPSTFTCSDIGENIVTLTVVDNSNNAATCQTTIIVRDEIDPLVNCLTPTIYLNENGIASLSPSAVDNNSTDNCGIDSIYLNQTSFSCTDIGSQSVTLTIRDNSGNIASCVTTITVADTLPPIPVCNDLTLALDSMGTLMLTDSIIALFYEGTNDNCSESIFASMNPPLSSIDCSNIGINNITVRLSDDSGSIDSCIAQLTVIDTIRPEIIACANNINACSEIVTVNTPTATDNCGIDTLNYILSGATIGVGGVSPSASSIDISLNPDETTITWLFVDASGNASSCTSIVINADFEEPPTPVCVTNITVPFGEDGTVDIPANIIDNGSFDNCTAAQNLIFSFSADTTDNEQTFDCSDVGIVEIELWVTDSDGNQVFCSTEIELQDNLPPAFIFCPDDVTINCGLESNPDILGTPEILDNCDDTATLVSQDEIVEGTACLTIDRIWTATDLFGNENICIQRITIVDSIPPVLSSAPDDLTLQLGDPLPPTATLLLSDNCIENVTLTIDTVSTRTNDGSCTDFQYTITRIWTLIDQCNNEAVQTQDIFIVDTIAPIISLQQDTIYLTNSSSESDSCSIYVDFDILTFVIEQQPDSALSVIHDSPFGTENSISGAYPPGIHDIEFTVIDACGNLDSGFIVVHIIDEAIPTAICQDGLTISLGSTGETTITSALIDGGSFDNCSENLDISISDNQFDCGNLGVNTITLTVIDESGNVNSCPSTITVIAEDTSLNIITTTSAEDETAFGTNDGSVSVTATGGSGNFSYLWDDVANSITTTVNNLGEGTYFVSVTDNETGCVAVDSAVVSAAPAVTFIVGEAMGIENEIVQIPVSVANFSNIVSAQMSFQIQDPTVASFVENNETDQYNLQNLGATNFSFNDASVLTFGWNNSGTGSVTLPNNTVIFVINILLTGNIGESTPVIISNSPVPLEVGALENGSPIAVPSNKVDGLVSISIAAERAPIKGIILTEEGLVVDSVLVKLSGTESDSTYTDTNGDYLLEAPIGGDAKITPYKNNAHKNGVTTLDLSFIQQHILGEELFDTPYKIIGSDANNDGRVSTLDLVELQYLILGETLELPNVQSWRFVSANYNFIDPLNPLDEDFEECLTYSNFLMGVDNADFIAIKVGDANLSADLSNLTSENIEDRNLLTFNILDKEIELGQQYEIQLTAGEFDQLLGFQMALQFDTEYLDFVAIRKGALEGQDDANFGKKNLDKGILMTNWFTSNPTAIQKDMPIFTLVANAKKSGKKLSEILTISNSYLQSEIYPSATNINNLALNFTDNGLISTPNFILHQNRPNPFTEWTTISFELPESTTAILNIYDISGKKVQQISQYFEKGIHNIQLSKSALAASGVLYYELVTIFGTDRKKMIILK